MVASYFTKIIISQVCKVYITISWKHNHQPRKFRGWISEFHRRRQHCSAAASPGSRKGGSGEIASFREITERWVRDAYPSWTTSARGWENIAEKARENRRRRESNKKGFKDHDIISVTLTQDLYIHTGVSSDLAHGRYRGHIGMLILGALQQILIKIAREEEDPWIGRGGLLNSLCKNDAQNSK